MSDKTGIEWTDATWNPIRGCSRVSEGCRFCYAEGIAHRFSGEGKAFAGLVTIGGDGNRKRQWNGTIQFVESALLQPLRWKRGRRIFVNSMSDLFHPGVTDEMLDRIFAVMALCPQHTFQVLTKRPERMLEYLSNRQTGIRMRAGDLAFDLQTRSKHSKIPAPMNAPIVDDLGADGDECGCRVEMTWPLPNVWLGVSVENQKAADERIPLLLQTPAAVRFLSCEPLLGPVDLWLDTTESSEAEGEGCGLCGSHKVRYDYFSSTVTCMGEDCEFGVSEAVCGGTLDWVIAGGESGKGPDIPPSHPDWFRSLRDKCAAAGVSFFFKQWGEWRPALDGESFSTADGQAQRIPAYILARDGTVHCFHNDANRDGGIAVRRVGKKVAGDLLDGVRHHAFPEVRA